MAFFKSSNPALKESTFQGTIFEGVSTGEEMTIKGTANKFGVLMLFMFASCLFAWSQYYKGYNPMPLMLTAVFGGLGVGIVMAFKKQWSPFLAPAYALLQGLAVRSISAFYDDVNKQRYPGIVMQAVALTLLVTLVMYLIYRFRIIRVTHKFKAVVLIACAVVGLFYLAKWIVYLVAGPNNFGAFTNAATPLGIGFSFFVVGLASLMLLVDFDMIEKGVEAKAPKYMDWYGAFGLLVTVVWLYLEILRLLSKLRSR